MDAFVHPPGKLLPAFDHSSKLTFPRNNCNCVPTVFRVPLYASPRLLLTPSSVTHSTEWLTVLTQEYLRGSLLNSEP
eukprot:3897572-Pyramimonas_sp.AAC.1